MRVLIIKTTSLGDVMHTLPAVNDAYKNNPKIEFDWLVEKPFAEIPTWHPAVKAVIPVEIRKWRKSLTDKSTWQEVKAFKQKLQTEEYDMVIDAQGLIKSALLTKLSRGKRKIGFAKSCAREPLSSLFYDERIKVDKTAHAIQRVRALFAQALGYTLGHDNIDYGLSKVPQRYQFEKPTVLLLHGTTWPTKHWPESYWRELAENLQQENIAMKCVWGNEIEKARAEKICADLPLAEVMPKLSLSEVASLLAAVNAAVAVDTGLGHMAAAIATPTISLYGPTNPERTGALGKQQKHFRSTLPCAPCLQEKCSIANMQADNDPPCMGELTPEKILQQLQLILETGEVA
jgi:heptosyltransferase-1